MTFVKTRLAKKEFMIFKGKLKDLQFDVNRWKWNREIDLLNYSSKNGCQWLKPFESLEKNMQGKWRNSFTNKVKLGWKGVW